MATYESKKYETIPLTATQIADGSVTDAEFQFINSLVSNAQTQITGRLQTVGGTMTGSIVFPDDTGPAPAKIQMGAGSDLKMYSNGLQGIIEGGTSALQIYNYILKHFYSHNI